jgi:uncharacterized membrane-anchored protein YitT (DUF2179 family)
LKREQLYSGPAHALGVISGTFLFALSYKAILLPLNFYNSGFTGISQIIQSVICAVFRVSFPFDATGLIYCLLNIPIFILSYRCISKQFFERSVLTTLLQSAFLAVIPSPAAPVLTDYFAAAVLAGAIAGFGVGLTLTCGSSSGGTDILGLYFVKHGRWSVGKIGLLVNLGVYTYGLFHSSLEIIIYSVLYCVVTAFMIDRFHFQNVKIAALIVSESREIQEFLLHRIRRGVTTWEAQGSYTKKPFHVFFTLISRYEAHRLKDEIRRLDPDAFVVFLSAADVVGSFEIRL